MERLLVYHNPSCSKSRGALEILADEGVDHDVVEYLRAPPDRAALERIVDAVEVPPAELVRRDRRCARYRAAPRASGADAAAGDLPGRARRDRAPVREGARATRLKGDVVAVM